MIDFYGMNNLAAAAPPGGPGYTLETRGPFDWLVYRESNGEVVAIIIIKNADPGAGGVLGFVLPKYQRQGYGTMVWKYAVETLGLRQEDQIVNGDAQAFFDKLNSEEESEEE